MFVPKSLTRFFFRLGKQVEPIIRMPDDCSVVDIRTTAVRDENVIVDTSKMQGWEIPPGAKTHAIYIDGVFKGHGHFVVDEGIAAKLSFDNKEPAPGPGPVPAPVMINRTSQIAGPQIPQGPGSSHTVRPAPMDKEYSMVGRAHDISKTVTLKSSKDEKVITARYEGHIGTLSAINMIQRGSVLQPSMMTTLIYVLIAFVLGGFTLGSYMH